MTDLFDGQVTQEEAMVEYAKAKQEEAGFQRWLLDDDIELTKLQMALTGKRWDQTKQQFVRTQNRRAKINDEGAETITWTVLYPIVKNAKLSRFSQEEINDLMYLNMVEITNHINFNLDTYEIQLEDVGIIITIIETFLKSVLNRALHGAEQSRLADSTGSQESYSQRAGFGSGSEDIYPMMPQPVKKKRKFFGF